MEVVQKAYTGFVMAHFPHPAPMKNGAFLVDIFPISLVPLFQRDAISEKNLLLTNLKNEFQTASWPIQVTLF
jgi:hypothetical protein